MSTRWNGTIGVPSGGSPKTSCPPAADCDLGSAAYDADNYACTGGVCIYTGCNNDAECQALQSGHVCRSAQGTSMATCVKGCSTVADCGQGMAPYDADNYVCVAGGCVYTGCNSSTECAALGYYVCAAITTPLPSP